MTGTRVHTTPPTLSHSAARIAWNPSRNTPTNITVHDIETTRDPELLNELWTQQRYLAPSYRYAILGNPACPEHILSEATTILIGTFTTAQQELRYTGDLQTIAQRATNPDSIWNALADLPIHSRVTKHVWRALINNSHTPGTTLTRIAETITNQQHTIEIGGVFHLRVLGPLFGCAQLPFPALVEYTDKNPRQALGWSHLLAQPTALTGKPTYRGATLTHNETIELHTVIANAIQTTNNTSKDRADIAAVQLLLPPIDQERHTLGEPFTNTMFDILFPYYLTAPLTCDFAFRALITQGDLNETRIQQIWDTHTPTAWTSEQSTHPLLAGPTGETVLAATVHMPKCPTDLLTAAATSHSQLLRDAILANPDVPAELHVMAALANATD